jgi:hypothetical protein
MRFGNIVLKTNEAPLITRAGVKFVEAEMWKQKARSLALAAREGGVINTPQQYLMALNQFSTGRLRRIAMPLALVIMAIVIGVLVFVMLQPTVGPAPVHNITTIHNVTTATTNKLNITVF